MSALWNWATCRPVPKRQHVAALQDAGAPFDDAKSYAGHRIFENAPVLRTLQSFPISQTGSVRLKHAAHFVSDSAEAFQYFLIAAGGFGRVKKWPVVAVHLAGENWTGLIRIATDRNDSVHALVQKFLQVLRAMRGNINSNFRHNLDGERVDMTGGIRAGALDIRQIAQRRAQNALTHVAATGVAGAQYQDGGLGFSLHA
jgi:hypothetical protein